MRNAAAAHFDDDFEVREPPRKKGARRTASPAKRKKKGKGRFAFLSAFDTKQVARYAAIGMSAIIAIGIMVNALALQKGRHPAPLFGKSIALGETPAPAPVSHPVVAKKSEPVPLPVAKPAPEPDADAPAVAPSVKSDDGDAIAAILQGKPVPTDHADAKTVLGVQRALVKLGFTVKTTGTFGPQTKKAIESFEKARHLPVKGEMSRRIVKVLAAESGLTIER